jgi:hypothetical protein
MPALEVCPGDLSGVRLLTKCKVLWYRKPVLLLGIVSGLGLSGYLAFQSLFFQAREAGPTSTGDSAMSDMVSLEFEVYGKVQGVFFRKVETLIVF